MLKQENSRYEVKLNRFFNIQSKQNIIWFTVLVALFVMYIVINLIKNDISAIEIIEFGCGCIFIMLVKLLSHPKRMYITSETIKFEYKGLFLNLLVTGHIRSVLDNESKYQKTYTVYNLKHIEYLQTPFEKNFSCGHIEICGDVNNNSTGKEQQTFVIYGVKDFENISAWMKSYIKTKEPI